MESKSWRDCTSEMVDARNHGNAWIVMALIALIVAVAFITEALPLPSFLNSMFSVKEPMPKTTARLTLEGHAVKSLAGQALAGLMKPNLVSDLIQRGALR